MDKTKNNTVTVYCNLPSGISFTLPDGRVVTFNGYPVSRLVSADGSPLPAGKFGVTPGVATDDWAWIAKTYADAQYMKIGLLFAQADAASGEAEAAEKAETRHGMEQANVRNRTADKRLPQGAKTNPEV